MGDLLLRSLGMCMFEVDACGVTYLGWSTMLVLAYDLKCTCDGCIAVAAKSVLE